MLRLYLLLLLLGSCHTCSKAHYGHLHGECSQGNRQPIRMGINCQDPTYLASMRFHGNNWVFYDYIHANPLNIRCCSHVHFPQTLINAAPLAPRDDFEDTQKQLLWLGQCSAEPELIKQWISFHIYFHIKHITDIVPYGETIAQRSVDCFSEVPQSIYHAGRYPIYVDRNHAFLIQYVLISNIELYSSPGLANRFMQMLYISTLNIVEPKRSIIYSINIFEIFKDTRIPYTKGKLNTGIAIVPYGTFHSNICPRKINTLVPSDNRIDRMHWHPIYLGTVNDSPYDNHLSLAYMSDILTQTYAICLMRYEFHILENLFPGLKMNKECNYRLNSGLKTHQTLPKPIPKEYIEKYGNKTNCGI